MIVIVLAFVVYTVFFKKDPELETNLNVVKKQNPTDILGQDILKALSQIQSLDLDKSIFSDPVYQSLEDKSEPINSEPVGRRDPFAPFNGSSPVSTSTIKITNVRTTYN